MMRLSTRRVTQRGGSLLDGAIQDRISGEVGWQQKSYPLGGGGTHALVWLYSKDSGSESGSDRGWVDYLQWTPSGGGGGSSTADWEQITYTYDPSGRRIAKDVDGEVTRYVYDGDQCIAEYDGDDTLLRKYVHGPCIDEPICMVEAAGGYAGTYYYHFDALGSVVALSDASGDTVQVYEYDVYGQVAASDPNHPNRFLFTGREFDKETGLYYYRARYYNPAIGRFLQTDPIGYADGMNAYTYCGNNGPNLSDPSGAVSGCGLRLREEGPYNDKGEPYAKFLEFYCIQDNGKPFEKLFRDIDEFMDWADSGGDGLFTDKWMQGEVGWELSGCHMTDKSDNDKWQLWRRWWFWRLKTLTWLDSSMNGVISRIESAEGHRIQLKFSHKNYYTGLDNTLEWNREADIISASNPWEWNHIHPLVGLAHELQHLHDDVYAGVYDKWSDAAREQSAMLGENSLRYALFQKDPTKCWLYPRPGYQDSYPDLGDTAKEAWENYNGRVGYGYTE